MIDREFAAQVLIEAVYTTDERACQKYGISERTLRRYRAAMAKDSELSAFVRIKKQALDKAWADELRIALHKGIRTLSDCMEAISADPAYRKNPMIVSAIAGAIKLCADIELTGRIIDARLSDRDRPEAELPGQGDSTPQYVS